MKNFNALVAIITGLKSEWVTKARRQAFTKIGTWEARVLRDMTDWTRSAGDFKHIHQTVDSLVEAKSSAQEGPVKNTDSQTQTTRSRAWFVPGFPHESRRRADPRQLQEFEGHSDTRTRLNARRARGES